MTVATVPLPELHDPDSGRLDAQRIANYLGVPLSQLAAALGKKYTTVYKTPASVGVQAGLRSIYLSLQIFTPLGGFRRSTSLLIPSRPSRKSRISCTHPDSSPLSSISAHGPCWQFKVC